ncbi:proline iminopeptidase-family hydrolase [Mycobacterium angelicum]|uniref:Proline iminopeptidase n=1 Tax=Mycobacterium angelicum TaxID=470074 RepID=A0A1X0A3S9_MYCAN|nr:proline iminopeptidase-family hydrolase [Mycobacterium angelicum]MCV7197900.1 proline iminopeptidase-family hydrolase [Mycobacterium angelicum]ORA24719.1 proline iminopeptidase [Mycobacterium angelicum]
MTQAEGTIAVPGGEVWFKRVPGGPGLPLLVVHGGPGLPHQYLDSLQRLAGEREVIYWDQLGCGKSERPTDPALWTMQRSMAEMKAVVGALRLDRFHVFGNSWGAMLALQYVLDAPAGAVSLTISNSAASISEFSKNVARLKSGLDPATQAAIDRHEDAGTITAAEYQAAIRIWNATHLCRLQPWPTELEAAFQNMGTEIFATMFGPSVFRINGTIEDWDVVDRLAEIAIPTLLLAARFDEFSPDHMREMHSRIAGSRFEFFDSTAHLPFLEEPERFDQIMRDFLRAQDI